MNWLIYTHCLFFRWLGICNLPCRILYTSLVYDMYTCIILYTSLVYDMYTCIICIRVWHAYLYYMYWFLSLPTIVAKLQYFFLHFITGHLPLLTLSNICGTTCEARTANLSVAHAWYHVWSTNCLPFRRACVVLGVKHELAIFPEHMRGTICEARPVYPSGEHAWYHMWSTNCVSTFPEHVRGTTCEERTVYLSGEHAWYHVWSTNCLPLWRICVVPHVEDELPTFPENMRKLLVLNGFAFVQIDTYLLCHFFVFFFVTFLVFSLL